MMDLGLRGLRALVGGASSGLGAAVAAALAAEGAEVAMTARRAELLKAVADQIGAHPVVGDLSALDGPAEVVQQAAGLLGGLDIMIVNTGGPPAGTFTELDEERWSAAIDGSFRGPIRLVSAALPALGESAAASIVVVLASTVRQPLPRLVTSNVLRPGLVGLVKSLAGELAPKVRVNGIAPGRIQTERADWLDGVWAEQSGESFEEVRRRAVAAIPLGRYGKPEEFARVAAFLASPAASYVSGQVLPVDGAMTRSIP
jgi:3-oxoacyl-[acyl-carrier protein] reductase